MLHDMDGHQAGGTHPTGMHPCSYNKKAFQTKANHPFADRCMGHTLNKLEQAWREGAGGGEVSRSEKISTGPGLVTWEPFSPP